MSVDLIEWGVATLALSGQVESGDLHAVIPFESGVLVAVIDGLGHGGDAAVAARLAAATLRGYAHESVISLVRRCDQELRRTRGAAMSLASFNGLDHTMTWLAVGNVDGVLMRMGAGRHEKETILQRGGVVGCALPPVRADVIAINPGDTLILATDGIRSGFADTVLLNDSPQHIADNILTRWGRETDDALALVARWKGISV